MIRKGKINLRCYCQNKLLLIKLVTAFKRIRLICKTTFLERKRFSSAEYFSYLCDYLKPLLLHQSGLSYSQCVAQLRLHCLGLVRRPFHYHQLWIDVVSVRNYFNGWNRHASVVSNYRRKIMLAIWNCFLETKLLEKGKRRRPRLRSIAHLSQLWP